MGQAVGAEAFEARYAEVFGDRWPALRAALRQPVRHVAWVNPFAEGASSPGDAALLAAVPGVLAADRFDPPVGTPAPYYLLDAASVLAARALGVEAGHDVLDLCAAPGGKTLVLAAALAGGGSLTANDRSAARRARLLRVLEGHLPEPLRARIRVTGHDGSRAGLKTPEAYDRVLVDAPCSSERHLLADPKAMATWSPARSRQLTFRQRALLAAAVDATRPGGRVVYATCALAPEENDAVVARILDRRAGRLRVVGPAPILGEATELGVRVLPDVTGYGPLYYAVLERPGGRDGGPAPGAATGGSPGP